MTPISKEEYIRRKNERENKFKVQLKSKDIRRKKHIAKLNIRAIKYFTRKINQVDSSVEPRIIYFEFDRIYTRENIHYEYSDFIPCFNALCESFDYLDISGNVYGINATLLNSIIQITVKYKGEK